MLAAAMLALPALASASSIVYVCPDRANLCRVDPATGAQTQLTTDGQAGTSNVYGGPSLSRDGSKLAFSFNYHVIVADASAGNRGTPFATTALVALMRPDGGQVGELEQTFSNPAIQLCTYNLDGSGRNCPYGVASAGWAPDNNLLISGSAGPPNYNLEICHVSAAANQPCADVRANDPSNDLYDPAVSPDGSTLAVTVANGIGSSVTGHIALYNYATGQFERNLTAGTTDDLPAWSPDGSQIAFQRAGSIDVIGINGAAGSERQLVPGGQPTWGGAASPTPSPTPVPTPTPSPTPGPRPGPAPPNTAITRVMLNRRAHSATFKLKAIGVASGLQCALVKQRPRHTPKPKFSSCRTSKTYSHLKGGKYTFYVRAVGPAGADRSPAVKSFTL